MREGSADVFHAVLVRLVVTVTGGTGPGPVLDGVPLPACAQAVSLPPMGLQPVECGSRATKVLQQGVFLWSGRGFVCEKRPDGDPIGVLRFVPSFLAPEVNGELLVDFVLEVLREIFLEHPGGACCEVELDALDGHDDGGRPKSPTYVCEGGRYGPDRPLRMLLKRV